MSRLSRRVLFTALLTSSAVALSTLPADAQTREGLILTGKAATVATGASAFLTTGIVEQPTPPPPPGGGGPRAQGFGVGAKIGPLFTSYHAATCDGCFNTSTGWEGGVWFGGNRGGRVAVMGELLYAKKKVQSSGLTGSSQTASYLEIPILLRGNIGSRSRNGISVYLLGGPVFDVNIAAKDANDNDIKDRYESLDVGVLFGGGIEITRFLVEGRFNRGLRNVLKTSGGGLISDIKTESFAVLFGLRFN